MKCSRHLFPVRHLQIRYVQFRWAFIAVATLLIYIPGMVIPMAPQAQSAGNTQLTRWRNLIRSDQADSAQADARSVLSFTKPGESDAALAKEFFDAGYYSHAVFWLRRLEGSHPNPAAGKALETALRNAGIRAYEKHDFSGAAGFLQDYLRRSAGDSAIVRLAAASLYQAGRVEESLSLLTRNAEKYPDDPLIFQMTTALLAEIHSDEELESYLNSMLRKNPGHEEARLMLGRLKASQGKHEESLAVLNQGLEDIGWKESWAEALAFLYHQYRQYARERQIYEEWMTHNPSADTLMLDVAETFAAEENWSEARRVYREYERKTKSDIHFNLAESFRRQGLADSALIFYQAYLAGHSHHIPSLRYAGEAAESLDRPDKALEFFQRWTHFQPGIPDAWMAVGRIFEEEKDDEAARKAYFTAEEKGGGSASAYALYRLSDRLGNEEALRIYRRLALVRGIDELKDMESNLQNQLNLSRGGMDLPRMQYRKNRHETLNTMIRDLYKDWIREDPLDLEKVLLDRLQEYAGASLLLDGLADVYAATGRPEKALRFYEKAVQRNSREIKTLVKLGDLYSTLGEYEKALRVFRSAVELSPHEEALMKRCIQAAEGAQRLESLASRWEQLVLAHSDYKRMRENCIALWHRLGRNDKVIALKGENKIPDKTL